MINTARKLCELADRAYAASKMALEVIEDATLTEQATHLDHYLETIDGINSLTDTLNHAATNILLGRGDFTWTRVISDCAANAEGTLRDFLDSVSAEERRAWWGVYAELAGIKNDIVPLAGVYDPEATRSRLMMDIDLLDVVIDDLHTHYLAPCDTNQIEHDLRAAADSLREGLISGSTCTATGSYTPPAAGTITIEAVPDGPNDDELIF